MPYDRFVVEQIAGDLLDEPDKATRLPALGFFALGPVYYGDPKKFDQLDDRIDTLSRGFLGLTVACARCHDHKFDPIPTADYYSLYGVFDSSHEPALPPLFEPPPKTPQYEAFAVEVAKREAKLSEFLHAKHDAVVRQGRSRLADYLVASQRAGDQPDTSEFMQISEGGDLNPVVLQRWRSFLRKAKATHDPVFLPWHELASLPKESFQPKAKALIDGWADRPDPARPIHPLILRELRSHAPASLGDAARAYGRAFAATEVIWNEYATRSSLNGSPATTLPDPAHEAIRHILQGPDAPPEVPFSPTGGLAILPDRASQAQYADLLKAVETYRVSGPGAPARAMILEDAKTPVDPRIFRRGNPGNPGETVPRRFLKVISSEVRTSFADGSGRSDLARAIASPDNPLTARVLVNRVWMHHFGTAIVGTPSDFGLRGDPPTHPELLDHLARSFVADGWSIKRLHRRIMLSATYAQASNDRPDARAIDPENALLWRANRRRLDFESTK